MKNKTHRHRPSRYLENNDGDPTVQEERVARRLGGKRVRGSGASFFSKADVRDVTVEDSDAVSGFLVECKQTIHKSLSIKRAWLEKITDEARAVQKEPALAIQIRGKEGGLVGGCDDDWVMIPARIFAELLKK